MARKPATRVTLDQVRIDPDALPLGERRERDLRPRHKLKQYRQFARHSIQHKDRDRQRRLVLLVWKILVNRNEGVKRLGGTKKKIAIFDA